MKRSRASFAAASLLVGMAWAGLAGATDMIVESPRSGVMQLYAWSASGGMRQLTSGPRDNANATWSPDGRLVAFVSTRDGTPQIYVMGPDGSQQRRLSKDWTVLGAPVWSPDGKSLAYPGGTGESFHVVVVDVASGAQRSLVQRPEGLDKFAWSPDGREILFVAFVWGQRGESNLHALAVDTGEVREVVRGDKALVSYPSWSPDGRSIAYVRSAGRNGVNVFVVGRDGKDARPITSGILNSVSPVWSPDGRWLAYESNSHTGERSDIFVVPAAGGAPRNVSNHPHEDFAPVFSPDSTSIFFTSYRLGISQIFRVAVEGDAVARVIDDAEYVAAPAIRPIRPAVLTVGAASTTTR